jgi:hypothetical protein
MEAENVSSVSTGRRAAKNPAAYSTYPFSVTLEYGMFANATI